MFLMLPDPPGVERVLFGEYDVAQDLAGSKVVVVMDMSSISPIETRVFAGKTEAPGCDYVDGPVSRGEVGARAATLSIMTSGTQVVFDRVPACIRRGCWIRW